MMGNVLFLESLRAGDSPLAGGKGANLGELAAQGFPVPPGFVVTTDAYRDLAANLGLDEQLQTLQDAAPEALARHCAALQLRILEAPLPGDLGTAILDAHARLLAASGSAALCAVRSSATAEDLAGASFAGQHGTYYYVSGDRLLDVVKRCWASLWSVAAVSYRATHAIPHGSVLMAVVVQEMIESTVSGVTFTANPVTGSTDLLVIEASWGMGAALVDGRVTPDRYLVTRDGLRVRERRIAEKSVMVRARISRERDARLERVSLSMQRRETLDDDQVRTVAEWSLKAERHFGKPQDVEWAISNGRVHILQSRPITTLGRAGAAPAVKGKWVLFKALAENFTDPMTPLAQDLVANPAPPGLRFIGGRIYMNLDLVRPLVPLRVSDEDLANLLYLSAASGKLRISWVRLPLSLLALLANHLVLGVVMARTRGLPDDALDRFRELCRRTEADATLDAVGAIRRLLLLPRLLDPIGHMALLANTASMRFMPWLGILKLLLKRWAPAVRPDAAALLCSGSEGVLSAMMGRGIAELAHAARGVPAVRAIIVREDPETVVDRLRQEPTASGFVAQLEQFLAVHGHRAIKEFELASPRWEENPAPVLAMIRNHLLAEEEPASHHVRGAAERSAIATEIHDALQAHPLEQSLAFRERAIHFAAERAKYYFKLRENSRFYHIMAFGVVRKKILAVEAELLQDGKLRCRGDIFFLTWDEVTALRDGRLAWRNVEDRIRQRRLDHVRLAKMAPPKTIGIELKQAETAGGNRHELQGFGASPGRYTGVARVILDPAADATLHPGEVLIAPYTDPAWTPLFLTAGAAVVEVGSYLSHAGTVAREYGMPCVVDVPDCTQRIQTGTHVEVDGDRGTVRILGGGAM